MLGRALGLYFDLRLYYSLMIIEKISERIRKNIDLVDLIKKFQ